MKFLVVFSGAQGPSIGAMGGPGERNRTLTGGSSILVSRAPKENYQEFFENCLNILVNKKVTIGSSPSSGVAPAVAPDVFEQFGDDTRPFSFFPRGTLMGILLL